MLAGGGAMPAGGGAMLAGGADGVSKCLHQFQTSQI